MDMTVCAVATYGDQKWADLAAERAVPSAARLGVPVISVHGESLMEARNEALRITSATYICFLDADDELEDGYFEAIARSDADLRVPAVRYMRNGRDTGARIPRVVNHDHDCTSECLAYGNWMVIGTVAPVALLRKLGGFRDFPWSEDWDLWVRCWKAGATIETVPDAVYRAHVRRTSRNRIPSAAARVRAHNLIAQANGLPEVA